MTPTAHPSDALPTLSEADAWAILGEAVTALRPLPGATRARVYEVTLGEGSVRIVKLLPKDTGRAAREAWVRGRMAGVGAVPMVPEVLHRATPLSGACDVVSMRPLPGQSLERALHDADEARARRLWSAFGEGLAAFHAVPIAGFGLLDSAGRGPFPAWRMALEHHAAAALDVLRLTPLSPLADPIARRIEALAPSLDDVRAARLTHGDAHPRNVRAAGDRLVPCSTSSTPWGPTRCTSSPSSPRPSAAPARPTTSPLRTSLVATRPSPRATPCAARPSTTRPNVKRFTVSSTRSARQRSCTSAARG